MRHHLILVRMSVIKNTKTTNDGESLERRDSSFPVGGNVNWYSLYGE